MGNAMNKKSNTKISLSLGILSVVAISAAIVFSPDVALARTVDFVQLVAALQHILTTLLLPIAIVLCAWKILYIAVVGGIMGTDPMNVISDQDNDGAISFADVKIALMAHVSGFVKGLLWVGGIFIIFQLVLSVAAMFAQQFADTFA